MEISANERISNLGILSYERKTFVTALLKLKKAFEVKFRAIQFAS
jgi:hypothetical protein